MCSFFFKTTIISEFVFIELTPLDHAGKILMQKILFILALIYRSRDRKDHENYGSLCHHFIHEIKSTIMNRVFLYCQNKSIIPDKVHLFLFCCFPVLFFLPKNDPPPFVTMTSEQKIRRLFIFPKICYDLQCNYCTIAL